METRSQLTVVYVLTTSGQDSYADMALVSALSVRQSNPGLKIAIVSDGLSAEALKRAKHRLLGVVDELRVVDAPYESAIHRNRSIKTSLYKYFEGPTLNLDGDTIVRGSLAPLMNTRCDFGAAANHNGLTCQEQLWSEDAEIISAMGWEAELPCYINTGVIFYRPSPAVREFYSRWHALWSEEREKTCRGRDQPSCYAALHKTQLDCTKLPDQFNFQFNMHERWTGDAVVLHFYGGAFNKQNVYRNLVRCAATDSVSRLSGRIERAIRMPFPWLINDLLARGIASRITSERQPTTAELLWLTGKRRKALRFVLGQVGRSFGRTGVRKP